MRILFITFEYPPHINGGAGVYAVNITRELINLDNDVTIITPLINGAKIYEKSGKLTIYRIPLENKLPLKAVQFWIKIPNIVKKAKLSNNFDIVHVNGTSYWFISRRLTAAPQIVTIHHLVKNIINNKKFNIFSRIININHENNLFLPIIEKRCIHSSELIIADSDFTKKQIIEYYNVNTQNVKTIYIATNLTEYAYNEKDLLEMKIRLGIKEKPIILFVGRINDPRKGLDILLQAYIKVLKSVDSTLLIVGTGDQIQVKNYLKSLKVTNDVLTNIVFTGYLDEESLRKCYALSDLYVCPSRLEGFGLTILEAMVAKKPIIATNISSMPELIKNNQNGHLFDLDDIDGLTNSIIYYLTNKDISKIIGEYNLVYVKNNYSWSKCAIETLNAYKSLVDNTKK
jgi:glycosyltransferase involved in cell wall biosynthesis